MKKLILLLALVLCFMFCVACDKTPQNIIDKQEDNVNENSFNLNDFKLDDDTVIMVKEKNSAFNILNLTDTQVSSDDHFDTTIMTNTIKTIVLQQQPNLITLTGDYVWTQAGKAQFLEFVSLMESLNIPWAPVMGNHDGESSDLSEKEMSDIFSKAKNCLYVKGDVSGYGNYVINVIEKDETLPKKGKIVNTLIMMDSGDNHFQLPDGSWGYGYIDEQQINWYNKKIIDLKEKTGLKNPKSILFFHIPLPEMQDAFDMWKASGYDEEIGFGEKNEPIACCSYNSGFFDVIKQAASTTHIINGHDHINSCGIKYQGIFMIYALKTGDGCSWRNYLNGGTLISISKEITVEHKYVDPYEEDIDVVYFVNCDMVGEIPTVGKNLYSYDSGGRFQTYLDQDYSLDTKAGYSWGRVDSETWLKKSERGTLLGDDACKYYSLLWAKENSTLKYEFEAPIGTYTVELGFYERWWNDRYADVTINGGSSSRVDYDKYTKRYYVYNAELTENGKISVHIKGVDGNDFSLSYIEIVKIS